MPYRSAKQRRFMHARHPKIAKRWDAKYGGKVQPKRKAKTPAAPAKRKVRSRKRYL